MSIKAHRAAPPNALAVWADAHRIYAELPTAPELSPCIMAFPRSAVGLSKIINLIYGHADVSGEPISRPDIIPQKNLVGTYNQHAAAQATLRQKGIIKK